MNRLGLTDGIIIDSYPGQDKAAGNLVKSNEDLNIRLPHTTAGNTPVSSCLTSDNKQFRVTLVRVNLINVN